MYVVDVFVPCAGSDSGWLLFFSRQHGNNLERLMHRYNCARIKANRCCQSALVRRPYLWMTSANVRFGSLMGEINAKSEIKRNCLPFLFTAPALYSRCKYGFRA